MPKSLFTSDVNEVLKATPSVTFITSGKKIVYPFPSPADWRDHWIYFLLVDRFNNPAANPLHPDPSDLYQGGNFEGIKEKLGYLKDLGVGAIWISPVLKNPDWFKNYWGGYGIYDFLRIEPRFCKNPQAAKQNPELADIEFRELVDEAHAKGIYVIMDIVLNHTGDLFNYEGMRDHAPWKGAGEYNIYWRDEKGMPQGNWTEINQISSLQDGTGIWPEEFQQNAYFRRRGTYDNSPDPTQGDFYSLKELVTEYKIPGENVFPVRNFLIRAYQYLIARFDLDGYRIDTLQYVEPEFARVFGNSMREYALSIGKKNFFTFGEVWQDDKEDKIAEFVGRNTLETNHLVGIDAAIDFPIRKRLVNVIKGFQPALILANHFDYRRQVLKSIVSSHGEAGRYYITFIDNHDLNERFHNPQYPEQTKMALTCLMTMHGIPCIYYGTEQGLSGHGDRREYVREALWGVNNAFSDHHEIYQMINKITKVRNNTPELRYGRQYFRPCSGNGNDFGYSEDPGGIISYSRILNDREVLIVANTSTDKVQKIYVAVDYNLNGINKDWKILFSTGGQPVKPEKISLQGKYKCVRVTLSPMEIQILK